VAKFPPYYLCDLSPKFPPDFRHTTKLLNNQSNKIVSNANATMAMHLISPTDALFTLNSSLQHNQNDTQSIPKNTGKSLGAGVTGVCFVKDPASTLQDDTNNTPAPVRNRRRQCDSDASSSNDDTDEQTSDDDDDHPLQFRCSSLLLGPQHARQNDYEPYQHATHLSAASYNSLSGALLASCHTDGSVKLWDLATRRCRMNDIFSECPRGASGLAIRRLGVGCADGTNEFLYQTRDRLGSVTLHDLNHPSTPLLTMHTHSTTFCAISPCHIGPELPVEGAIIGGARHLVALPTEEHSVAIVRDLRSNPQGTPAWRVSVGDDYISSMYGTRRKYGMLTSLALCLQESTNNIVLGCGMENGSALFYDLGALGRGRGGLNLGKKKRTTPIL